MRRLLVIALLVLGSASALVSCLPEDDAGTQSGKLVITATVGMVADTVERVGGDLVVVTPLMGPGVDPHLYKASARDLNRLRRADIVFYNGLHLEGKMVRVLGMLARSGEKAVAVGEEVDQQRLLSPSGYEGQHDPHIWFDVSIWAETIDPIVEALSEADPDNGEIYRRNGDAYREELASLHEEIKARLAEIPTAQRVLITAHDAFGYFGRAYDVEVVGLQGLSTVGEFGVKDRKRLVDLIIRRGIKAVFVESSVPKQAVAAVVDDCRQLGHSISIGGELYSDAMGEKGTPEGTYVGMVRHNVESIVNALK